MIITIIICIITITVVIIIIVIIIVIIMVIITIIAPAAGIRDRKMPLTRGARRPRRYSLFKLMPEMQRFYTKAQSRSKMFWAIFWSLMEGPTLRRVRDHVRVPC